MTESSPDFLPVQLPDASPYFQRLENDWFGALLESRPSFRVVLHPGEAIEYRVTARKQPISAVGSQPGEFHEGLWQHDCAELWLANPSTGHYIEFNLAPNGAWWSCLFEAPRINALVENLPLPGVIAEGLEGIAHWEASLRVPLSSLPEQIGQNPSLWTGNVTFCLGSAPKQKFTSFARLGEGNPDYHRPAKWLPLRTT